MRLDLLAVQQPRDIAELLDRCMRRQVQRHVGLLSVAYYDENRTGTVVARIMTDVEGVRNLVGTGLVEFVGGMLTAVLSFLFLLHLSVAVTLTVFSVLGAFVFVLQYGFRIIRPIFRERGKINAEVTGRLTESLGGVAKVAMGEPACPGPSRGAAAGVSGLKVPRHEGQSTDPPPERHTRISLPGAVRPAPHPPGGGPPGQA